MQLEPAVKFRLRLRRYVEVEPKVVPSSPCFVDQMNLYISAVGDLMRHPDDAPPSACCSARARTE